MCDCSGLVGLLLKTPQTQNTKQQKTPRKKGKHNNGNRKHPTPAFAPVLVDDVAGGALVDIALTLPTMETRSKHLEWRRPTSDKVERERSCWRLRGQMTLSDGHNEPFELLKSPKWFQPPTQLQFSSLILQLGGTLGELSLSRQQFLWVGASRELSSAPAAHRWQYARVLLPRALKLRTDPLLCGYEGKARISSSGEK